MSINGKKASRVGDGIGCGGSVSSGSGDTLIGDGSFGGALQSCMKGAEASGAAFVKVAFDAFPVPPNVRRVTQMALTVAQGGPEALLASVKSQALGMAQAQVSSMASAAFGPAVTSLSVAPTSAAMQAAAGAAPLQDALIGQVTRMAGGALTPHVAGIVGPQLAQAVVSQATAAIRTGQLSPQALAGSAVPAMASAEARALAAATAQAVDMAQRDDLQAAVQAMVPTLAPLAESAAQDAVYDFSAAHEAL